MGLGGECEACVNSLFQGIFGRVEEYSYLLYLIIWVVISKEKGCGGGRLLFDALE